MTIALAKRLRVWEHWKNTLEWRNMVALPNIENITQENLLDTVKRIVGNLKEINDTSVHRDQTLVREVRQVRTDLGKRIDQTNTRLVSLEDKVDGLQTEMTGLRTEMKGLRQDVDTRLSEQTDLLKMIAENTKRK